MSFSDLAFRIATVRALRGRTDVGQRVYDTPVDPMADVMAGDTDNSTASPVIAVYTNQAVAKISGNDLMNSENRVELTVQIYMPYVWTPDPMAVPPVRINGRDAGGRLMQDILTRQVYRALLLDNTPWANAWRDICFQKESVRSQSFVLASDSKYEVAAREIILTCELASEPAFETLTDESPYKRLMDLAAVDPQLEPIYPMLLKELTEPSGTADWQHVMAELGCRPEAVAGIGVGLGFVNPPEDAVPLLQVVVENEDGGGVTVDDGSIIDA